MQAIRVTPVWLWLSVAAGLTVGAVGAYLVTLRIQREGADDPQIQLAEDGAAALEKGRPVAEVVPADTIDIAQSLAPFVVVLDDAGQPLASSGQLNGRIPVPPAGVLAIVRNAGETRVTWAPRKGLRLASIVRRVQGPQPGFIVAARSLREVQSRIAMVVRLIAIVWGVSLVGLTASVAVAMWTSRRGQR